MPLPANIAVTLQEECLNIIQSSDFRRAPVMSHLLQYLVDYCVQRDARGPKAYVVAVDGLGRDANFDTNIDSYPRVQVGRLRKMIAAYYSEHPRSPRLDIPVGHYQVKLIEGREESIDAFLVGAEGENTPTDPAIKNAWTKLEWGWALLLLTLGINLGVLFFLVLTSR